MTLMMMQCCTVPPPQGLSRETSLSIEFREDEEIQKPPRGCTPFNQREKDVIHQRFAAVMFAPIRRRRPAAAATTFLALTLTLIPASSHEITFPASSSCCFISQDQGYCSNNTLKVEFSCDDGVFIDSSHHRHRSFNVGDRCLLQLIDDTGH